MLRAAIIGLGNIGWKYDFGSDGRALTHLSTYMSRGDVEVVAGFDANAEQADAFFRSTGVSTPGSVQALLDAKPDIVSICSPNALHADHLRACLEAKVPMIWLEKPVTLKAEEARDLSRLSQDIGQSTVLVGFQRRYLPAYQRLRTLIERGEMGAAKGISITYSRGLETNGVHLVDLIMYLLGDTSLPTIRGVAGGIANPASPSFVLGTGGGLTCSAIGLDLDHHSIDVTVHFEAGRQSVLYGGARELRERRIENPLYPGFYRLAPEGDLASEPELSRDAMDVFPHMLEDLISAHNAGQQPLSSLNTAVASQVLVEDILSQIDRA